MCAWRELMFTIVPLLRAAMCGMTALAMRMMEKTLVSYVWMISAMSMSMTGPAAVTTERER